MNCIHCGKENADYDFHVLQVQTLHVRDLTGEKRVQALGDFEDYSVCAQCAREKYDSVVNSKTSWKRMVPFALMTVAGFVITAIFLHGDGALRLFGLGMLACGILGAFSTSKSGSEKKRSLLAMGQEKALAACAWECMVDCAPKKNDVNDITYIPINEDTLARKNGDLMILYDLLPEIAVQAHKRIHGEE